MLKNSHRSEFIAVYGRRRVGKTVLIRKVFNHQFAFQTTAIAHVKKQKQLLNFYTALERYTNYQQDLPFPICCLSTIDY